MGNSLVVRSVTQGTSTPFTRLASLACGTKAREGILFRDVKVKLGVSIVCGIASLIGVYNAMSFQMSRRDRCLTMRQIPRPCNSGKSARRQGAQTDEILNQDIEPRPKVDYRHCCRDDQERPWYLWNPLKIHVLPSH